MKTHWKLLAVGLCAVAALSLAFVGGRPTALPAAALGSVWVLYAERALTIFVATVALLTVLTHAAEGRLPTELGAQGLKYDMSIVSREAKRAQEGLARAITETQQGLGDMRQAVAQLNARVQEVQSDETE